MLKKSFWSLLLLTIVLSFLNSCTVQKRLHTKGYHVDFHSSRNSQSEPTKKQFQKVDIITSTVSVSETMVVQNTIDHLDEIHQNLETNIEEDFVDSVETYFEKDLSKKRNKHFERIIDFSFRLNEKIFRDQPSIETNNILDTKNELLNKIPIKYNQDRIEKETQSNSVKGSMKSATNTIILAVVMVLIPVVILIALIPAIILTVMAKSNSNNKANANKLWVGAWICWGLIFLLFLWFVVLLLMLW